jgi:phosphoglycolate phosphatase (TIGR01487 family)
VPYLTGGGAQDGEMAGFFQVVAVDLDGTLTTNGRVQDDVVAAIDDVRERGVAIVLVTGRTYDHMVEEFPGLDTHFDVVVLENGCLTLEEGERHPLTTAVDMALSQCLQARGLWLRRGECLLALSGEDVHAAVEEIGRMGLDCQVLHNRSELMVLPSGISKGTGLHAALEHLGTSAHNTIAVGDAENDLSLLDVAEVGVAVANATPSLQAHADLVLNESDGAGVVALLRGPLIDGSSVIHPTRRRIKIGHSPDGSHVTVPGAQANIVVCGRSGTGKSRLAGLLVERWHTAGYSVLVIDPEGDHHGLAALPDVLVVEAQASTDAGELAERFRRQHLSIVLDLSKLSVKEAEAHLRRLAVATSETRAIYGLPHWVVIDEAHNSYGAHGMLAEGFGPSRRGHCLVTYQPDRLWTPLLSTADVIITALGQTSEPGLHVGRAAACIRHAGGVDAVFELDPRTTPHTRHRLKYAETMLPEHQCFLFRDREGNPVQSAASITRFADALKVVHVDSVRHHALRGDFSRWLLSVIQDEELAAVIEAIENDLIARISVDAEHTRRRMFEEVVARYLPDLFQQHG